MTSAKRGVGGKGAKLRKEKRNQIENCVVEKSQRKTEENRNSRKQLNIMRLRVDRVMGVSHPSACGM